MDKVLAFSKKLLREKIDKNSIVVDATMGNGNDTLFLAKSAAKKIYAFDIQKEALNNTTLLLKKENLLNNCHLILDSHLNFDKYINEKIDAVIFNLGYLPNADHSITTTAKTTIETINKFIKFLSIGGRICIVVYSGHTEGKIEKKMLLDYLSTVNQKQLEILQYQFINQKNDAPFLLCIEKLKED